jgi:hypothetical protein
MEAIEPMSHQPQHFKLTALHAQADGRMTFTFGDGKIYQVDLKKALGRHPILKKVLAPEVFGRAKIADMGRTLRWPGSDDHEVASDQLRAWGIDQAGGLSHARFIAWMFEHELTLDQAAEALGLSRRMVAYYRDGSKEIPKTVALACRGWEAELAAA